RLGVIKDLYNELRQMPPEHLFLTLEEYGIEGIIKFFGDEQYCYRQKTSNGVKDLDSIVICGKIYLEDITMKDFLRRITESYEKYGERSRQALKNKGLDFKALSHAYRAIIQTKQLLINATIKYPFEGDELKTLMDIKQGLLKWKRIEEIIYHGLDEIEKLQGECQIDSKYDYNFIRENILKIYWEIK
ncbi:unnamed protein product, partial [marine sediment metagenome]